MQIILITAPTQDVITLEEAKAQLRITSSTDDDLVQALIDGCLGQFDPASGGWLGRAFRPQTWELQLDGFPCGDEGRISLPYPPLITLDSIKYDDAGGTERTLAVNTDYIVGAMGGRGKQYVAPAYGKVWPSTRDYYNSVRIRFTAGYDADEDPDMLPAPMKQAALLSVRNLYSLNERSLYVASKKIEGVSETRWVVSDAASEIIRKQTEGLLSTYQVW